MKAQRTKWCHHVLLPKQDKVAKNILHREGMEQAAFHGCFPESTTISDSVDKAMFH